MRVFRPAKPEDFVEIDIIRAENGSTLPREEDVNYFVSDRDGMITAFYGWRMDPVDLRALVIDFYGSKARDWMDLLADMNKHADDVGIQLSGWVDLRAIVCPPGIDICRLVTLSTEKDAGFSYLSKDWAILLVLRIF